MKTVHWSGLVILVAGMLSVLYSQHRQPTQPSEIEILQSKIVALQADIERLPSIVTQQKVVQVNATRVVTKPQMTVKDIDVATEQGQRSDSVSSTRTSQIASMQDLAAVMQEEFEQNFAHHIESFAQQAVDPVWAAQAQNLISNSFSQHQDILVAEIDCRETVCRVVVRVPDTSTYVPKLASEVVDAFPRMTMDLVEGDPYLRIMYLRS